MSLDIYGSVGCGGGMQMKGLSIVVWAWGFYIIRAVSAISNHVL